MNGLVINIETAEWYAQKCVYCEKYLKLFEVERLLLSFDF